MKRWNLVRSETETRYLIKGDKTVKKISSVAKLALVLLTFLVIPGLAMAESITTPFSGTETLAGPPVDPGTETFPDGNYHMRGFTALYYDANDDPRVTGHDTVVANWNFRPAPPPAVWMGPMWGTLHIENDNGTWDGRWTGTRDENGYSIITAEGHGSGDYAGLKAPWTFTRLSPDPTAPFDITGWILDPQG
jgi:hypothetical protein